MNTYIHLLWLAMMLTSCRFFSTPSPQNEQEQLVYMMGQIQADSLQNIHLSDHEIDLLLQGLKDRLQHKASTLNHQEYSDMIKRFVEGRVAETAQQEKQASAYFLKDFLKKGGKQLPSGLAYKIITPGNSQRVSTHSLVEVHLHGTLRDGTIVASTIDHGKKETYALDGIIPGLQEGLSLIGEDGEIQLLIPSELGYGDQGVFNTVPGGAYISYYAKLFKIK